LLTIRYVSKRIRYEVIKYVNSVQQSDNGHSDTEDSDYDAEKERELSSSDDEHQSSGTDSDICLISKDKKKPIKHRVASKLEVSNKRVKASGKSAKVKKDSDPLPGEWSKKRAPSEEKPSQDVDAVVGERKSKRRKVIEARIRETMAVGASEEGSVFTENDVQQAVYHQMIIGVRTSLYMSIHVGTC
jgi:hypothetical protein